MLRRFNPSPRFTTGATANHHPRKILFSSSTQHTIRRHCATTPFDNSSSSSTGGGPFGSILRLLGLTAAFAVGSFTIIIVSWPILDAIALPLLFKRAIRKGSDQFKPDTMLRSEVNQADTHIYDEQQVQNLSKLLFPVYHSSEYSSSTGSHHHKKISKDEEEAERISARINKEYSTSSIVVLTGPKNSNKSDIARRVALCKNNKDNDDSSSSSNTRPTLVINLRGFVDSATFLHGTLTYLLLPSLGLLGSLVHAYIKLTNAAVDILTMNNSHEYNSFIFFCMTMGHVRQSLFALRDENLKHQRQNNKPLIIVDHVEQLLHNHHLFGKDSAVNLLAQMMMTFFLRAAVDEKICDILLVTDSSALTNKYDFGSSSSSNGNDSGRTRGNKNSNKSAGNSSTMSSSVFGNDEFFSMFSEDQQSSSSDSASNTVANSDLMQCFPCLCQRAKFADAIPRQVFPRLQVSKNLSCNIEADEKGNHNNLNLSNLKQDLVSKKYVSDDVCEKLLRRVVSHSTSPPPILVGRVASLLLEKTLQEGYALDVANLASSLGGIDHDSVFCCLEALEAQGLAERVVGSSLLFPSPDEKQEFFPISDDTTASNAAALTTSSGYNTSLAVPSFLASETLRKMSGKQILENSYVDVQIPIRNVSFENKKTSSSSSKLLRRNDHHQLPSVSTTFKQIRLSLLETEDRDKVLLKVSAAALSATSGNHIGEVADEIARSPEDLLWSGLVLPRRGNVLVSSKDEFQYHMTNSVRDGEIFTPSRLPRNCSDDSTLIDGSRNGTSWTSLLAGTTASFIVGASTATAIALFASHIGLVKMSM